MIELISREGKLTVYQTQSTLSSKIMGQAKKNGQRMWPSTHQPRQAPHGAP